jgi:RNA recognition motif-containing protein
MHSAINKSVLIKNLVGKLAYLTEKDIRRMFQAFGEIVGVELQTDRHTGQNVGYGTVQFAKVQDANSAIQKMNGFIVSGEPLIVAQLPTYLSMGVKRSMPGEDGERYRKSQQANIAQSVIVTQIDNGNDQFSALNKMINPELAEIQRKIRTNEFHSRDPTKVLGIFNLFDPETKDSKRDKDFFDELKADVKCKIISRL